MTNNKKRRVYFDGLAIAFPKGTVPAPIGMGGLTGGKMMPPDEMPPVIRSAYEKWRKQLGAGRKGPSPKG